MKTCKFCKHEVIKKEGSFTHTIFGKDVTLNDVPYFVCVNCNHSFYEFPKEVEKVLTDLALKGQSEGNYPSK